METRSQPILYLSILLPFLFIAGFARSIAADPLDPPHVTFCREFFELLQIRDFPAAEARIDPAIRDTSTLAELQQIASVFPVKPVKEVKTVGNLEDVKTNVTLGQGSTEHWAATVTLQYQYPDTWVLATAGLTRKGDSFVITSGETRVIPDALDRIHAFSLSGKGARQYAALALSVAIPLFILFTLVLCIRTPIPRRKWLWMLFVAFGLGQLTLNWTTGAINVRPLQFQLLGAGYVKLGPYAPILLSVSVPIGAIVFLVKRKQWLRKAKQGVGGDLNQA